MQIGLSESRIIFLAWILNSPIACLDLFFQGEWGSVYVGMIPKFQRSHLRVNSLKFLWLSEWSAGGRPNNSTNPLRVCPVYAKVSFKHGNNFLNKSLLVYKFPPINCLTDLIPTFRLSIYNVLYQQEICLNCSFDLSVLNGYCRRPVYLMN